MAKEVVKSNEQRVQAPPTATQEIRKEQWIQFLAEFTRENRGAHARVEVLGPDVGYQVETDNRPFGGISTDIKDNERAVWITFGSTAADHLAHGVQNVAAIRMRPPVGDSGAAVEVVAQDGTRTVLELSRPEAYELPPGAQ
jgi:Family of unknown function (DUF5335)